VEETKNSGESEINEKSPDRASSAINHRKSRTNSEGEVKILLKN